MTACVMMLAGCMSAQSIWHEAEYWQRMNIRDTIHMDPVKAQDMLNRDIARCVADVRDDQRMAALRVNIPPDSALDPRSPESRLAEWDTPERDGYLMAEQYPYHDFESCMNYKGWERTANLKPALVKKSQNAWLDNTNPGRKAENRAMTTGRKPSAESQDQPSRDDYSYLNF